MPRQKSSETVETKVIEEVTEAENIEVEVSNSVAEADTAVEEISEVGEDNNTVAELDPDEVKPKKRTRKTKGKKAETTETETETVTKADTSPAEEVQTEATAEVEVTHVEAEVPVEGEAQAEKEISTDEVALEQEAPDGTVDVISEDNAADVKVSASDSNDSKPAEGNVMFAEAYDLSPTLFAIFRDAIITHKIMSGTLCGLHIIEGKGIMVQVSVEGEGNNMAMVHIDADKMGLNVNSIRQSVIQLAENRGITLKEPELSNAVERGKFRVLRDMVGAKIYFVPTEIIEDSNFIVGNRTAAMKRLRNNFLPTRNNPEPRYKVGSIGRANILSVTNKDIKVEFSGYEVRMTPEQISPLVVDLNDYHIGDYIRVVIRKVTENGISLVGEDFVKVNMAKRLKRYSVGSIVAGEVYLITPKGYYIKLADRVNAIAHYTRRELYVKPQIGDKVRCVVTGYEKEPSNTVRVRII